MDTAQYPSKIQPKDRRGDRKQVGLTEQMLRPMDKVIPGGVSRYSKDNRDAIHPWSKLQWNS